MKPMRTGACLLATLCVVWGCGEAPPPEPEAGSESEAPEEPEEGPAPVALVAKRELPETPLPQNSGLYVVTEAGVEREIRRGERGWLERTNAERGFGFEQPHGVYLSAGTQPLWALRSSSMELSTLRLTRYEAEALLPPQGAWTEPLSPGRFAWLPAGMLRVTTEIARDDTEVVRLRPVDPLTPGFYVLHDGAVTRGRLAEDVSAFYPFQVLPEGAAEPKTEAEAADVWLTQVMPCARELEVRLAEQSGGSRDGLERQVGPDRDSFARVQGDWIRHCASQIAAVMSASDAEAPAADRALAALRALQTIAQEPSWSEMGALLDATDPSYPTGALLYVWLELEALEIGHAVLQALEDGDDPRVDRLAPRLAAFHRDRMALRDLGGVGGVGVGRERLLWPPYFIDARWPRLGALSRATATPLSAVEEAATLLSAYHSVQLARFDARYGEGPLTALVDAARKRIAPQILVASEGLDPTRAPNARVVQGQLQSVDGAVEPTLERTIRDAFRERNTAFAQCARSLVRRQPSQGQGLFVLLVELKPDFPTGTIAARVAGSDPRVEAAPFGDEDFKRCLTRSLPTLPSYYGASATTLALPLAFDARPEGAP